MVRLAHFQCTTAIQQAQWRAEIKCTSVWLTLQLKQLSSVDALVEK